MTPRCLLAFAGLVAAFSCGAQARAPSAAPAPLASPAATPTPAAPQSPSPEQVRDALNRQQADVAQQQVGENYAREDNYADAVKARAAAIRRQQEAYAAELAAYAARKAQYEADLARWRASLPQCKPTRRHPCPAS